MRAHSVEATASLPFSYESRSGEQKLELLWERVLASRYEVLPPLKRIGVLDAVRGAGALWRTWRETYRTTRDILPARDKLSHPHGVVGRGEYVASEPCGGVLDGAPVLFRLALAGHPDDAGFQPGLAVKFLIDGHPSVNVHAAHSLDPEPDWDFFAVPLSQRLDDPVSPPGKASKLFVSLLTRTRDALLLDLDHLVFRDRRGVIASDYRVPHTISFRSELACPLDRGEDFRNVLGVIPPGTGLYQVWLQRSPKGAPQRVGTVVMRSRLIASSFGDRVLHFHHRRHELV